MKAMTMQYAMTLSRWAAAGLIALSLGACETTGDPRHGGIFWSDSKALARQDELRRDAAAAQREVDEQTRRGAELRGQQQGLSAEEARLQSEFDRLMTENKSLDSKLRELMKRRQLGEGETARLRRLLADNQRLRAAAHVPMAPKSPATQLPPPPVDAVNDQNGRLHREVMILLQLE